MDRARHQRQRLRIERRGARARVRIARTVARSASRADGHHLRARAASASGQHRCAWVRRSRGALRAAEGACSSRVPPTRTADGSALAWADGRPCEGPGGEAEVYTRTSAHPHPERVREVAPAARRSRAARSRAARSTAGAGSGDFHQYRQARRREQDRLTRMDKEEAETEAQKAYDVRAPLHASSASLTRRAGQAEGAAGADRGALFEEAPEAVEAEGEEGAEGGGARRRRRTSGGCERERGRGGGRGAGWAG